MYFTLQELAAALSKLEKIESELKEKQEACEKLETALDAVRLRQQALAFSLALGCFLVNCAKTLFCLEWHFTASLHICTFSQLFTHAHLEFRLRTI